MSKKIPKIIHNIGRFFFLLVSLIIGIGGITYAAISTNNSVINSTVRIENSKKALSVPEKFNDILTLYENARQILSNPTIRQSIEPSEFSNIIQKIDASVGTLLNNIETVTDEEFYEALTSVRTEILTDLVMSISDGVIEDLLTTLGSASISDELLKIITDQVGNVIEFIENLSSEELEALIRNTIDFINTVEDINVENLISIANTISSTTKYGIMALISLLYLSGALSASISFIAVRNSKLVSVSLNIKTFKNRKWIVIPIIIGVLAFAAATVLLFLVI